MRHPGERRTLHTPHDSVLGSKRRSEILDLLDDEGSVRVAQLSDRFGVSDMTVRRDIERLAEEGLLRRVRGGALPLRMRPGRSPATWVSTLSDVLQEEPPFDVKSRVRRRQKQAIAALAATLVSPGDTVGFTGGTTPCEVALAVREVPGMAVVTNSVRACEAVELSSPASANVVLTGGVRTPSEALVGPIAVRSLVGLHIDRLFLGAQGTDPMAGLTSPSLAEAETNRALMACARKVCLVFDSSKWGVRALCSFASLTDIDEAISDDALPPSAREFLANAGVHLLLATVDPAA